MEIIDLRKSNYLDIDGVTILKNILNQIPNEYIIGVQKISLLDTDYEKIKAIGKWRRNYNSKYIQIEIMFDTFDKFSRNILEDEITIYLELGRILLHELYHNYQKTRNKRILKQKVEEFNANEWALKKMIDILNRLFPSTSLLNWKRKYENIYLQELGWV